LGGLQDVLWTAARRMVPRRAATPPQEPKSPGWLSRRAVLAAAAGAIWAAVARRTTAEPRPLRPPGAIDEGRFSGACIRCGNCIRACPTRILEPDRGAYGIAGLLAPVVRFARGYCLEDCTRCTEVCPSGAIRPVTLEAKRRVVMGVPYVDMEHCLLGDDRECAICRNRCPYEAIALKFSEESYTLEPRVDRSRCPGCGACEAACPTEPKSIVVRPS
jgi:ferredoxin-type protein NapF